MTFQQLMSKAHLHNQFTEGLSQRQQRIYVFLQNNPVATISTVSANGEPHGSIIYFTIDKEFSLFFLTKTHTQKFKNLHLNNKVMLTVYEPLTQTVAQVHGEAQELKDGPAINSVAAAILGVSMRMQDGGLPPISKLQEGNYTAFRINPAQITITNYSAPEVGSYEDLFEKIETFDLHS